MSYKTVYFRSLRWYIKFPELLSVFFMRHKSWRSASERSNTFATSFDTSDLVIGAGHVVMHVAEVESSNEVREPWKERK